MTKMKLYYSIIRNYRSCSKIYTYTLQIMENMGLKDEDISEIDLEMPKEGIRIYIINEFPYNKPVWYKDLKEDEDYNKIYEKIFSQLHECMPFVVTSYTSKEKGYYPAVSDEMKEMEDIEGIKEIENRNGDYFLCVIDSKGNELLTKLLRPV
jgi:hypothetical protein